MSGGACCRDGQLVCHSSLARRTGSKEDATYPIGSWWRCIQSSCGSVAAQAAGAAAPQVEASSRGPVWQILPLRVKRGGCACVCVRQIMVDLCAPLHVHAAIERVYTSRARLQGQAAILNPPSWLLVHIRPCMCVCMLVVTWLE
ncbi:hypothetical protein HaLaN_30944 [Haematococcus lacustris]|uniref:Uncharacterized protein n=1 Tax=Haematococcus lacustris TaxID=44745 RepID=A0A6A0AJ11_HAELA|nr:hypothetical protein HaLaN_30944 [Haematococcus lacustris]